MASATVETVGDGTSAPASSARLRTAAAESPDGEDALHDANRS